MMDCSMMVERAGSLEDKLEDASDTDPEAVAAAAPYGWFLVHLL